MLSIFDTLDHQVYRGGPLPPLNAAYDFLMAGNGLFIRAKSPFVRVVACIAAAEVRGLPKLSPRIELRHRRLPATLLARMVDDCRAYPAVEILYQVVWRRSDGQHDTFAAYRVAVGTATEITYTDLQAADGSLLLDLHSHHRMAAYFSRTDDAHHTDLRWYAVVGRVDQPRPQALLRLSVYGYFVTCPLEILFDSAACVVDLERKYHAEN